MASHGLGEIYSRLAFVRVQFFTNFAFLDYKFRYRYVRNPTTGSKDSDDSLVSKKKLDPKICLIGLATRVGWRWRKRGKNASTCDDPHREPKPKTKVFFSILTRRLAESVDGLNSSLAESVGELWRCKPGQKCVSGGRYPRLHFHEFFKNISNFYSCYNYKLWIIWKASARETYFSE